MICTPNLLDNIEMKKHSFTGKLKEFIDKASVGSTNDIDYIMDYLSNNSDLATTRFVDYALSNVINREGVERIRYYLFHGSQIQRNYASLYFNRQGEWKCVKEAYEKGLIDEIQAFAR